MHKIADNRHRANSLAGTLAIVHVLGQKPESSKQPHQYLEQFIEEMEKGITWYKNLIAS